MGAPTGLMNFPAGDGNGSQIVERDSLVGSGERFRPLTVALAEILKNVAPFIFWRSGRYPPRMIIVPFELFSQAEAGVAYDGCFFDGQLIVVFNDVAVNSLAVGQLAVGDGGGSVISSGSGRLPLLIVREEPFLTVITLVTLPFLKGDLSFGNRNSQSSRDLLFVEINGIGGIPVQIDGLKTGQSHIGLKFDGLTFLYFFDSLFQGRIFLISDLCHGFCGCCDWKTA